VYSTIAHLRQILGDSAESPSYIATVPRKGYRLIAEVVDCPEPAVTPTVPASVDAVPSAAVSVAIAPPAPRRPGAGKLWAALLGVVAVSGLAAILYTRLHRPAATESAGAAAERAERPPPASASLPATVAVLPFLDLSEAKDFEYFSDGLTEELIDSLSHNTALRVPARTSSFFFKGKAASVAEVAKQLNVDNLLEGSIRRSGSTVRVTAQLIRAADGYHLWSETYDRNDADDLAVEDDIASKVAETLRAKLTPHATSGVPVTLDNATRNLLMECQFYVVRNTPADTLKSVSCFQKLVAANPASAVGWAGYANALLRKPNMVEEWDSQKRSDKHAAVEAARRALQLDQNTAAAHAALAQYWMSSEFNWDAAQRELDAALKSDPNDPLSLLAAARLAEYLGRTDELISLCGLAHDRDPLNFLPYARLWVAYTRVGRYQDAEAMARRRLDLSPDGSGGHADLALALLMQGRTEDARAEAERESDPHARLLVEGIVYQAAGNQVEADAVFNEAVQKYGNTNPMLIAELSAYRGDSDGAFEALNAGVSAGSMAVYLVKVDHLFNALRTDPRYPLLLQRMRLAD
jgi:TolB-like protein